MDKKWIVRSQNLYIIRELWKMWSDKDVAVFYKMIGIDDTSYSAFIRNYDKREEADRKILKRKEKIILAGFQYEWFTGEIELFHQTFRITDKIWLAFIRSGRFDDIYNKVYEIIQNIIKSPNSDRNMAYYKVYKAVYKYNYKVVMKQIEMGIKEIEVGKLSADAIKDMLVLTEQMEQFIADVKAVQRYYELTGR